jgi:hypothetical protein
VSSVAEQGRPPVKSRASGLGPADNVFVVGFEHFPPLALCVAPKLLKLKVGPLVGSRNAAVEGDPYALASVEQRGDC